MRAALILLSTLAMLLVAACSGPMQYNVRGSRDPGADLHVVADINPASNMTSLELSVMNLAPPDRINAAATAYVAWVRRGADATWTRLGAFEFDAEARKGKLIATTPEVSFDLIITAEPIGTAASPSPDTMFQQRVQKQ